MKFLSIEKYETFSRFIANDKYITMSNHPVKTDEDTNSNSDNDEDKYIEKKVIMHRRIQQFPLLLRNQSTDHDPHFNKLFKFHIDSFVNFITLRASDSDGLKLRNTSTWFVSEKPSFTCETFKEKYRKLQDTTQDYMTLLPLKVVIRMQDLTDRAKQWYLTFPFTRPGTHPDLTAWHKYLKGTSYLHLLDITCKSNSETYFHSRSLVATKNIRKFNDIDEFFNYLF